jgi:hypothetical protein
VDVDGDTVVVGAPSEDSSTTGVNSTPNDLASSSGAVYVFVRSGTTWAQQAYLKASNSEADDVFGQQVAVDGDTIVVGAHGEDSAATGVDGDQSDNSADMAGAAYVFVRTGTTWSQQAYLKASNAEATDDFGWEVAVDGDTIVVTAPDEDSSTTEVNSIPNEQAIQAGAAYVFVRSDTTWSQQAYLKASNPEYGDYFGYSVAVEGDTVVVGAPGEDSAATGVDGNQSNNSAESAGAAYVFVRSGTTWVRQAYLKASNTELFDAFGDTVAVDGGTIVVGAPLEGSAATGVNGDQGDNSEANAGAAYVFERNHAQGTPTWTQQAYLKASNSGNADTFGRDLAVDGDMIVVGAPQEASAATGVNGDRSDNSAPVAGAAYTFMRNGETWTHQAYLKASNTDTYDYFSWGVALDGDTIVVGAIGEGSAATGMNGNQADNSAAFAGAAYIMSAATRPAQYLPLLVSKGSWLVAINAQAIPTHPVATAGETYYTTTIAIPAPLPAGGHFYLSSAPDSVQPILVDDELVVTVNGQERLVAFATYPLVVEVQRAEITQWLGQNVVVSFRDKYGSVVGSTPVWLIWAP